MLPSFIGASPPTIPPCAPANPPSPSTACIAAARQFDAAQRRQRRRISALVLAARNALALARHPSRSITTQQAIELVFANGPSPSFAKRLAHRVHAASAAPRLPSREFHPRGLPPGDLAAAIQRTATTSGFSASVIRHAALAALGTAVITPVAHPLPLRNGPLLATLPSSPANSHLRDSARSGFDIGFRGPALRVWVDNHSSCYGPLAPAADALIAEHLAKRWMIDVTPLYEARSLMRCIAAPQAVIPKSTPGKYRLLFDGSHGVATNVNDNCDLSRMPFPMCTTTAEVREMIATCSARNPGTLIYLYTTDLKDAYKSLPVHPSQWHTLAVPWNGRILWNTVAPFGMRSSASHLYAATAPAIARLTAAGVPVGLFVDDAFTCAPLSDMEGPSGNRARMRAAFTDGGFTLQELKETAPSTARKYIGWHFDTVANTQTLPAPKLRALRAAIRAAASSRRMRRSKLEGLLGHLHHAVEGSRHLGAFTAELQHLLSTSRSGQWITISPEARLDLNLWGAFSEHFNGTVLITLPAATVSVYTDACTSYGWGWYCPELQLFGADAWPPDIAAAIAAGTLHINALELIAATVAITTVRHRAPGTALTLHCDNSTAVGSVAKGRGKAGALARITRTLAFLLEVTGAHTPPPRAAHIQGSLNTLADTLSRGTTPGTLSHYTQCSCPQAWISWLAKCEAPWRTLLPSSTTAPLGAPFSGSPPNTASPWCPPLGN